MESPISRSYFDDVTFTQAIRDAKRAEVKNALSRIGEYESIYQHQVMNKVLENTSKFRVQEKFKALKNSTRSL